MRRLSKKAERLVSDPMDECDLDTSVPDWIIEHPETLATFQELGIDYGCGGKSLAAYTNVTVPSVVRCFKRSIKSLFWKVRSCGPWSSGCLVRLKMPSAGSSASLARFMADLSSLYLTVSSNERRLRRLTLLAPSLFQHRPEFKWVVGQNTVDSNVGSLPPVVRNIAADDCACDERALPSAPHSFHLLFRRQIAEIDQISVGCGESLGKLIGVVGDRSRLSFGRSRFDPLSNLRFGDGSADE